VGIDCNFCVFLLITFIDFDSSLISVTLTFLDVSEYPQISLEHAKIILDFDLDSSLGFWGFIFALQLGQNSIYHTTVKYYDYYLQINYINLSLFD
tara:strand:+ start:6459 stop:6743 length:285 start_codon:yes stop_codon:yes gene_type:complete